MMVRTASPLQRSEIFVAVGFNPRCEAYNGFLAPVGAKYLPGSILPRWGDMPLLRSFGTLDDSHPPVETGGYKYCAPTERRMEGLMSGTERPRFPDLTLGRSTFKRAAVEDMGAEQGELL